MKGYFELGMVEVVVPVEHESIEHGGCGSAERQRFGKLVPAYSQHLFDDKGRDPANGKSCEKDTDEAGLIARAQKYVAG